jgi:hypothetical protein
VILRVLLVAAMVLVPGGFAAGLAYRFVVRPLWARRRRRA